MEHRITARDGRVLAVQENGPRDGLPVLVFWGTPNSRHLPPSVVADATARGIRLIGYDRPGYGRSDPQPGRVIASCAPDVRDICAVLGISRLAAWGGSGGGPHVLACAALLPDLVVAAATLASLAPYPADGLDWFAGTGQDNIDSSMLALTDPAASREMLEKHRAACLAASAEDLHAEMSTLLSPADRAVMTGELARYLKFTYDEGLAPGVEGYWGDEQAFVSP
ncbi:MAG TPA: alpha/beta fold hydrolase [Trebonia sp.]|nr:alpha/beta fold hydrolase [Trebonia sp.]